ncbi:MAG: 30S ribosomal protein S1 [Candidatus Korobacteraceae bacterium]
MSQPDTPKPQGTESDESFADILSQFEKSHSRKTEGGGKQIEATVVSVTADSVFFDIGFKSEGVLPLSAFEGQREPIKPGDKVGVSVKGRNEEGYYELSRFQLARPADWPALEQAFAAKATILGTVTGVVKGGLTVDVGVRAFLPASRSGTRDAADLEKLVGQEIRCRITKLDVTDEDVVVDRRAVLEEEERVVKERRYSELQEGDVVHGMVRSLTDYGAFVDLGGVDGLLHVGDISWSRIGKPGDVLSAGQEVEVRVLKVESGQRRISLGMKQLQPHPWQSVAERLKVGERIHGTVTRLMDFGAFVEIEPGVEGLIHISEMSWGKKVRTPGDAVKLGETVEAVILAVNSAEHRISLGLKQALGNPWADAPKKFPVGSVIEGPVTSITKFGAFVQLAEGIEGMIHVSDMSAEKRINHPQDVVKMGQTVKAQVLEVDTEKRRVRLGIKQMLPTSLEEYIAERKEGDVVTGRVVEVSGNNAQVELGEGVRASCSIANQARQQVAESAPKADLSSLSSMLQSRWKGSGTASGSAVEAVSAGQVRSFRITRLDAATRQIELALA